MWIVKGFKQSAWPSRWYKLEIETVTKIFYDIMLFMFKRRIMVYYVDNETSPAEQCTNLKSRLSQRSSMTSCCLHLREEWTIM